MPDDQVQQSPSPSAVGFQLHRRSVLKGAAAIGGVAAFGALAAACGSDDESSSDSGSGEGAAAASGTVRVGSNYSDEKPNEALKAVLDATVRIAYAEAKRRSCYDRKCFIFCLVCIRVKQAKTKGQGELDGQGESGQEYVGDPREGHERGGGQR